MPIGRKSISQIQSYQPMLDYRKLQQVGVTDGQNFSWDASGVRADFATRLIAGNQSLIEYGNQVQSVQVVGENHLIVGQAIYRFVPTFEGGLTGDWVLNTTLVPTQTSNPAEIPLHLRHHTVAYLGGYAYVNSWNYGCYRVDPVTQSYTRLTQASIPGFPDEATDPVLAIAETSGRMVYMTETAVYWSAPGDAESLVPALGGAGFQVLAERVSGTPRVLLPIANGFMLWTTEAAMVGEFTGGPLVFRFYEFETDLSPLNQSATVQMPDSSFLTVSPLGLHRIENAKAPESVSPMFSEFLREYFRFKPTSNAYLWYSLPDNRVFFGVKQGESACVETFCLDLALDKWGILSHTHYGMFTFGPETPVTGYMDPGGVTHYLLAPLLGERSREMPEAPGTFMGLDSSVTLGYVRDEQLLRTGAGLQELNEMVVYHNINATEAYDILDDEGFVTDPFVLNLDDGLITDPVVQLIDEGVFLDPSQLTDGYKVEFLSDYITLDPVTGDRYGVGKGFLAVRGINSDTWTGSVIGHYLSIRFYADTLGEFFRINAIDCSLSSAGQVI